MLLFRAGADERNMSPEEMQTYMTKWGDWVERLTAAGKYVAGHPLSPGGKAVSGRDDIHVVDGPYAETRESIAGYFLLSLSCIDEAAEIAKKCPSLEYGGSVEVREIAQHCPNSEQCEAASTTEPAAV